MRVVGERDMKNLLKSTALIMVRKPAEWLRNRDGVAAIEFALIAPIMIAFYFGLSEVSIGIGAARDVTHSASVAGDLATQSATLDELGVEDVLTAALAVLNPRSSEINKLTIELNSYKKDADGNIELIGYARVGPTISAGGPATYDPSVLGNNMLNTTSGVVVARVNYNYTPATLAFMQKVTLHETFLLKPRKSLSVPFDEGGKSSFTCSASSNLTVGCTGS